MGEVGKGGQEDKGERGRGGGRVRERGGARRDREERKGRKRTGLTFRITF